MRGRARFVDAHTVVVGDRTFSAPQIVIATGGRPVVPAVPGADRGITSDGFFELEAPPARVAVIGTGYVAVELGGTLAALGAKVSLFMRQERLLRSFDVMLSAALMAELTADGVELVAHAVVAGVKAAGDAHRLVLSDGREFGDFDCVLWAIGRQPVTADLGLERIGVATYDDGVVITDRFQATNVEGVYAIGDVTGREALTPVAIAAGRRLADRPARAPSGLRTDPDGGVQSPADRHGRADRKRRPRAARGCGAHLSVVVRSAVSRAHRAQAPRRDEARLRG